MISVITPTTRPEGLEIVQKALLRQTLAEFEWVVIAPRNVNVKGLKRIDTLLSDPPKPKNAKWTLNRAYNKAIRYSGGELIISWQDWTFADPDAVEKFAFHFQEEPRTLVSGVGHKYADDSFSAIVWKDPRDREQGYYPCYFNDIEFNFCSIPREALYAVGGFDEQLDFGFGMDGYSVVDRLNSLGGFDFKLSQDIRSYSLPHARPPHWEEENLLHGGYLERKTELQKKGEWPVLDYLKTPKIQSRVALCLKNHENPKVTK